MIRFLHLMRLFLLVTMAVAALPHSLFAGEVSGTVHTASGQPAAGVTIHFWHEGKPNKPLVGATLADGGYRLELSDGVWHGAACDAPDGYTPLFWDATVTGGRLTAFTALNQRQPAIASASPVTLKPWAPVTLTGSGFGCSGQVEIDTSWLAPFTVTQFTRRNDGQVSFTLPTALLEKIAGGPGTFRYRHGLMVSAPIPFIFNGGGAP